MTDSYLPATALPALLIPRFGKKPFTPRSSTVEVGAELVASLMWGPKTTHDLVAASGANRDTVGRWLKAMHASGIVRIGGYRSDNRAVIRLWELQSKPFALPDAEKD